MRPPAWRESSLPPGITATSSWLNRHGPEATSRRHLDEQAEQTSGFLPVRAKGVRGLWTRDHGGARDACSEKGPKLPSGGILSANGSQLPDVEPKPGVCHVPRRLHTLLTVSLSEPEEPVRPGRDSLEDSAPTFPPLESSLQQSGAAQIPGWEHRDPPASQRPTAGRAALPPEPLSAEQGSPVWMFSPPLHGSFSRAQGCALHAR